MAERKTVRFERDQIHAIEDMVERERADNESAAVKKLLTEGMRQYGYKATGNGDTSLKWAAGELARLLTYVGLGWLAFFWAFPVDFRVLGAVVLVMALAMVGVYLLLDAYEPAISRRLFGKEDPA